MPTYEICFRCNDCKREHPTHIRIHLDHGPDRKETIAEFFRGGSLPPQVATIQHYNALCLKTGRRFKLKNNDQVFLIPTTNPAIS
jgi:hypothetical protein